MGLRCPGLAGQKPSSPWVTSISDMHPHVFGVRRDEFQILGAIVGSVVVLVVDTFAGQQLPSQNALHYEAMFVVATNQHVAVAVLGGWRGAP